MNVSKVNEEARYFIIPYESPLSYRGAVRMFERKIFSSLVRLGRDAVRFRNERIEKSHAEAAE